VTNEKRIGLKIESKWKLAEFGKDGFAMDASNVLLVSHANGTSMLRVFSMARSLSLSPSLSHRYHVSYDFVSIRLSTTDKITRIKYSIKLLLFFPVFLVSWNPRNNVLPIQFCDTVTRNVEKALWKLSSGTFPTLSTERRHYRERITEASD